MQRVRMKPGAVDTAIVKFCMGIFEDKAVTASTSSVQVQLKFSCYTCPFLQAVHGPCSS